MTEDEALEELNDCIVNCVYIGCDGAAMHKAIKALIEIKRNKWIPCSERLPEHDGQVLIQVSGKFRNIFFEDAFELAEYDKNEGWILEAYPEWKNPDVTAWQPLPEPYKKEEQHDEN